MSTNVGYNGCRFASFLSTKSSKFIELDGCGRPLFENLVTNLHWYTGCYNIVVNTVTSHNQKCIGFIQFENSIISGMFKDSVCIVIFMNMCHR